jgi:hypothetical protein
MKVIFLGINGVLNTDRTALRYGQSLIDQNLVKILKKIIIKTKAEIVLSSSWRNDVESRKMIKCSFEKEDIDFIDYTPQIEPKKHQFWINRCDEIKSWLKNHPQVKKFVIVDDNFDAGLGLKDNFFQTDAEFGITEFIAEEIIKFLNE